MREESGDVILGLWCEREVIFLKSAGKSLGIPADFSETPDLQEILFSWEIRRKILIPADFSEHPKSAGNFSLC
jgi:hypothetical protein